MARRPRFRLPVGKLEIEEDIVTKKKSALWCAAIALGIAPAAFAVSSVNLQFGGAGSTLADTGFGAVYQLDPTGFLVGGGKLSLNTLPGDTFGDYENDPDSAKNMFYTEITPFGRTVVQAKVTVANLNVNFHGGGVWMGTDQDHYIRAGVINNTFEGGISFESLRENEDLWPGATIPGPGNDIDGKQFGLTSLSSPLLTPAPVVLRIIRNGNTVRTAISLDDGVTWSPAGGPAVDYKFTNLATSPTDPGIAGVGNTVEGVFKVGVYAFGGPDGSIPGTFDYDTFTANSFLLGDFNSDRSVNLDDFTTLAANFGGAGVWETGDANDDGTVNLDDFTALAANFGLSSADLPRATVPEPALCGALGLMLFTQLAQRRRRS